jgi:hypothetical protein
MAARSDKVAPPGNLDRIDRQRDRAAALASAHLKNKEMAAHKADPDQTDEHPPEDALDAGRP